MNTGSRNDYDGPGMKRNTTQRATTWPAVFFVFLSIFIIVTGLIYLGLARLDQVESLSGSKREARFVFAGLLSLISMAGLVTGGIWRRRETRFLARELRLRDQVEAALRQTEERHQVFLTDFQGIDYQIDIASNQFLVMQGRVESLSGYSPEEFHKGSIDWNQLVHPEDLPMRTAAVERLITQQNHVADNTYRIRRRDGEWRWVNDIGRLTQHPVTGRKLVQGAVYDVTDRLRTEEQLRKLSRAIEQSPASIVITDLTGTIEYANPKFCALTGYSLEEVQGKNPRMLKSGAMDAAAYRELWETILSGKEWRGELHNRKKNGEMFWEFALISGIKNASGRVTHFIGVKEDITTRKALEAEREKLIQELEQALVSVRTLRGLIPICAACKKIRDDKGFWNQVESYVAAHSEAKFSHGLCPECAHRLYPELLS